MSIGQRIITARQRLGISQARLATTIGVSRGACGQWEREITAPSTENLARLAILLKVNFEWLTTGRGEMDYSVGVREASSPYRPTAEYLSEEQQGLLEAYSHLTTKQRSSLLDFLKTLR